MCFPRRARPRPPSPSHPSESDSKPSNTPSAKPADKNKSIKSDKKSAKPASVHPAPPVELPKAGSKSKDGKVEKDYKTPQKSKLINKDQLELSRAAIVEAEKKTGVQLNTTFLDRIVQREKQKEQFAKKLKEQKELDSRKELQERTARSPHVKSPLPPQPQQSHDISYISAIRPVKAKSIMTPVAPPDPAKKEGKTEKEKEKTTDEAAPDAAADTDAGGEFLEDDNQMEEANEENFMYHPKEIEFTTQELLRGIDKHALENGEIDLEMIKDNEGAILDPFVDLETLGNQKNIFGMKSLHTNTFIANTTSFPHKDDKKPVSKSVSDRKRKRTHLTYTDVIGKDLHEYVCTKEVQGEPTQLTVDGLSKEEMQVDRTVADEGLVSAEANAEATHWRTMDAEPRTAACPKTNDLRTPGSSKKSESGKKKDKAERTRESGRELKDKTGECKDGKDKTPDKKSKEKRAKEPRSLESKSKEGKERSKEHKSREQKCKEPKA